MATQGFRVGLLLALVGWVVMVPVSTTHASIGFINENDYSNLNPPTTGRFRDFSNGANINRGMDLGGTNHTALNFTGSAGSAGGSSITLYDTNLADAVPSLWSGNTSLSADVLISPFNNSKSAGFVTLFNEGTGKGLALMLWDAGNTDALRLHLIDQTGVVGGNLSSGRLASVPLSGSGSPGISENQWYRLNLAVTVVGDSLSILGSVYGHTTVTDPSSALGSQVGSNLTFTGSLSALGLQATYEVGLAGKMVSANVDSSITNFAVDVAAPEPSTVVMCLQCAAIWFGFAGRRRKAAAATSVR